MTYNELLDIYKNKAATDNAALQKLLKPMPLEKTEELLDSVSSRFRFTGPGKWAKIIREDQLK